MDKDHHGHADDARNRRDIANEIEINVLIESSVNRVGDGG
jgi:hypothetical protein